MGRPAPTMNAMHTRTESLPASDVRWAVAAHLSPIWVTVSASMLERRPVAWAPLVAFAGPLLLVLLVRERSAFVAAAFRGALAFALSIGTYSLVAGAAIAAGLAWPAAVTLLYVGLLAFLIVALNWLIFVALATRVAVRGRPFDYPGCLPIWQHIAARLSL